MPAYRLMKMFNTLKKQFSPGGPANASEQLQERVIDAIREVYDPEISINIYDLGLIYDIRIDGQGNVSIKMTLTAPGCPVAGILPGQVQAAVAGIQGVNDVAVDLVWDPPWNRDNISDEAKLSLGLL